MLAFYRLESWGHILVNFSRNSTISEENEFGNIIYQLAVMMSWPQCVDTLKLAGINIYGQWDFNYKKKLFAWRFKFSHGDYSSRIGMLWLVMMTSSNGNIFHVTGPLCGKFTGHRWIPRTKVSNPELWCFLWAAPEPTVEQTMETLVIWVAIAFIMTSL